MRSLKKHLGPADGGILTPIIEALAILDGGKGYYCIYGCGSKN